MLASNDELKMICEVQAILETLTDQQRQVLKQLLLDSSYHPEQLMDELKIRNFYELVKAKVDEG